MGLEFYSIEINRGSSRKKGENLMSYTMSKKEKSKWYLVIIILLSRLMNYFFSWTFLMNLSRSNQTFNQIFIYLCSLPNSYCSLLTELPKIP